MSERFEFTNDPNVAKNYNGFISRDGKFYLVSKRHEHEVTHQAWAYNFVTTETNFIKLLAHPNGSLLYTLSRLKDKQDVLIHFYGFVYYSHDEYSNKPITIYPREDINDKSITIEQRRMLFDVMRLNNEEKYYSYIPSEKYEEEKHEKYVDNLIAKRLEEVNKK